MNDGCDGTILGNSFETVAPLEHPRPDIIAELPPHMPPAKQGRDLGSIAAMLAGVVVLAATWSVFAGNGENGQDPGGVGPFDDGRRAGALAKGDLLLLLKKMRGVNSESRVLFLDGASHSFVYRLENPLSLVEEARNHLPKGMQRLVFLRGFFFRFGWINARKPRRCMSYVDRHRFIKPWHRAFAMANGMAWAYRLAPWEGAGAISGLRGHTRGIFVEELSWQATHRIVSNGFSGSCREMLWFLPQGCRCVGYHGCIRAKVGWRGFKANRLKGLLSTVPGRCMGHAIHGAIRAIDASLFMKEAVDTAKLKPWLRRSLGGRGKDLEHLP